MVDQSLISCKTTEYFRQVCFKVFLTGFPNFWIEPLPLPNKVVQIHSVVRRVTEVLILILLVLEVCTPLTQKNLSEKRQKDLNMYVIAHTYMTFLIFVLGSKCSVTRKTLQNLFILKKIYNNEAVDDQMIKLSKSYNTTFLVACMAALIMFNIDGILTYKVEGNTYSILLTVWPTVDDTGYLVSAVRLFYNVLWWIRDIRGMTAFVFLYTFITCTAYQFTSLHEYFLNLNDIFKTEHLSQSEKEEKYLEALTEGVKIQSESLKLVQNLMSIGGECFSAQLVFNVILLVSIMAQFVTTSDQHRNLSVFLNDITVSLAILLATGIFMTNSGNVTHEASSVSTAMYMSGWHNCERANAVRARRILVSSMIISQKPVSLVAFGVIPLCHESYVSILKFTYSVFSLFY